MRWGWWRPGSSSCWQWCPPRDPTMRRVLTLCALAGFAAPVASAADPPVVTVPSDMTVEAQSFAGAAVTYTASAVDHRRPDPDPRATRFGVDVPDRRHHRDVHRDRRRRDDDAALHDHRRRQNPAVACRPEVQSCEDGPRGSDRQVQRHGDRCRRRPRRHGLQPVLRLTLPARSHEGDVLRQRPARQRRDRRLRHHRHAWPDGEAVVAARPLAGARVSAPPMLRWRAVPKAKFYNAQVYRNGRKILSLWPQRRA